MCLGASIRLSDTRGARFHCNFAVELWLWLAVVYLLAVAADATEFVEG